MRQDLASAQSSLALPHLRGRSQDICVLMCVNACAHKGQEKNVSPTQGQRQVRLAER